MVRKKNYCHRITRTIMLTMLLMGLGAGCSRNTGSVDESRADENQFPEEMTVFAPYESNPVFTGTGADTWDQSIRERGYILREDDGYHLWYTGFRENVENPTMYLGYATSPDGITWTRYKDNPIFTDSWVEDMMVVKSDSIYYMFAEGENDIAHMLTSTDKIHWEDHGSLNIRYTNGQPLTEGPYGTPTVFVQDSVWYLFYERNDEGIWLASSKNLKEWLNIQDEPVIKKGPEEYDKFGVALNQVLSYQGNYYAFYHGTAFEDWSRWSTNVAVSKNLIDWKKYPLNPIMEENKSSGILVHDSVRFRLYTMHPEINLHFTAAKP
jgi:hypothetical protein